MRQILTAMAIIVVVATLAGAGTFAYFSDTEISTGNIFQADVGPDLALDYFDRDLEIVIRVPNGEPIVGYFSTPPNWAPGDIIWGCISLHNIGKKPIQHLVVHIECVSEGGEHPEPEHEADPEDTSDLCEVIELVYAEVKPSVEYAGEGLPIILVLLEEFDDDKDGHLKLSELACEHWDLREKIGFMIDGDPGPLATMATTWLNLVFQFEEDAGNAYQGDRCTMTITFTAT